MSTEFVWKVRVSYPTESELTHAEIVSELPGFPNN